MDVISSTIHFDLASWKLPEYGEILPLYLTYLNLPTRNSANKFIFLSYFSFSVTLQGPLKGRRVEDIQYEDISKLAWDADCRTEKIWLPKTILQADTRLYHVRVLIVWVCIYNVYRN